MSKQLYTVKDIAEQLGVSERSVREAIKRGELPGKKICGKWVTSAEALNAFICAGYSYEQQG